MQGRDRYPFVVAVDDVFERPRTVAFGAENGHVICSAPNWWKASGIAPQDAPGQPGTQQPLSREDSIELQEAAIGSAYAQAVRLARQQRAEIAERRKHAEREQQHLQRYTP